MNIYFRSHLTQVVSKESSDFNMLEFPWMHGTCPYDSQTVWNSHIFPSPILPPCFLLPFSLNPYSPWRFFFKAGVFSMVTLSCLVVHPKGHEYSWIIHSAPSTPEPPPPPPTPTRPCSWRQHLVVAHGETAVANQAWHLCSGRVRGSERPRGARACKRHG